MIVKILLILAALGFVYFLKRKSRNDFFKHCENDSFRGAARVDLVNVLKAKGRNDNDIDDYLIAFDFFCEYPQYYDGATIVRDLYDVAYWYNGKRLKLDLDAMLHDYDFIKGVEKTVKGFARSNVRYYKNMLKNGKGNRFIRCYILLMVILPFYVPYSKKKYNEFKH